MNRVIKFRAISLDGKGWVFGFLYWSEEIAYILPLDSIAPYQCIQVIPETIGQFTGRTDVNGIEIYEGDKVLHGESERFVEYRWTNFVLTRIEKTETILLSFSSDPKVIGNIHENKKEG